MDYWRTCAPLIPWLLNHNVDNFCQPPLNPPTSFVHRHYLVNYWPKEDCFLLCLIFMPNDVPSEGSGRRKCILLLIRDQFPKSHLGCDPSPTKLGHVRQERFNFGPPPSCWVKEKVIQFSKDQSKLSMRTSIEEPTHLNPGHWTWKNYRRYNIPHIKLHLSKGKVLQPNSGLRKGAMKPH